MSASRIPAPAIVWVLFVALAFVWGSSFLFIKIGLEEGLQPLTLVTMRLAVAAVFLVAILRLTGGRLIRGRDAWRTVGLLAVVNICVPFVLITWGEQHISSALASILNGLVPLFTIVIAALVLRDEPITLNRVGGLAVGFAGAVLLVSPSLGVESLTGGELVLLGEIALVTASLSYAVAAVYIRRSVTGRKLVDDPRSGPRSLTPVEIALPQVIVAGAITTALAILLERPAGGLIALPATGQAWLAVAWLGALGSGVAYLLFFRIVTSWGATRTTFVTYVMPIVGIALGVIVLAERLHLAEVLGSVLIIGGLVLANSSIGQRRLFGRASAPAVATPSPPSGPVRG